jgi:hypothetical protein
MGLMLAISAMAQGNHGGGPGPGGSGNGQQQGGSVIGPDGTYYLLIPEAASSSTTAATTNLEAIGVAASPATAWTVNLSGNIGPVLPGANDVYVVQTVTSGTGSSATSTTSVLWLATATGTQVRSTAVTGNMDDIQVKTISGVDYLYIYTTTSTSTTSGSTTTITTTRTLTIYAQNGTVVKTVTL